MNAAMPKRYASATQITLSSVQSNARPKVGSASWTMLASTWPMEAGDATCGDNQPRVGRQTSEQTGGRRLSPVKDEAAHVK
jgi:hypothetical protein